MDAYYLWDPHNGIHIGPSISDGRESKFLVRVDRPNGLEAALTKLAMLAMTNGKKQRLEIHCHGHAGALSLGGERSLSNHNVQKFGGALRQAIEPGGLIELLACLVASQEGDGDMISAPKYRISGYREDYHGALRLRRTREYDKSLRLVSRGTVGPNGVVKMGKPELAMARNPLPNYGGRFTQREKPIGDDPNAFFNPAFEKDGLRFCLQLAVHSGCTVRAATCIQTEEGSQWEHTRLANTPIGNWEFEVFDFNPDGRIQFLGSSPYRGPINSFDVVQRFPAA